MSNFVPKRSPVARFFAQAERCQYEQSPASRPWPLRWARAAVILARRWAKGTSTESVGLGPASRFAEGDWVRVRDEEDIRATLDAEGKLRGLLFMDPQWSYCGNTYRVERVVRRMIDDSRQMRTIAHAVVLAGVTCDVPDGEPGCGAACAMLFKDDWLEPASAPPVSATPPTRPAEGEQSVRVKSSAAILRTLGHDGRLDGISPSPQMLALAGQWFRVARRREFLLHEPRLARRSQDDWYILDGVRCDGLVLGSEGPCHRSCGLLWHESWLEFES